MQICWNCAHPHGIIFDGATFGDGSGKYGFIQETRRVGFGVVSGSKGRHGKFLQRAAAYGPVPGPQVVPLAELYALMIYLTYAIPTVGAYHFITDCQYVIDGFNAGKAAMTHGLALYPGIWKEVFRRIGDIGHEFVKIAKVKAHRSIKNAISDLDGFSIAGNDLADKFAKKGAGVHPHIPAQYNDIQKASALTQMVGKYIAQAACKYLDENPDEHLEKLGRGVLSDDVWGREKIYSGNTNDSHVSVWCEGIQRFRCKRCLRTAAAPLKGFTCKESWRVLGHCLVATGTFLACFKCGAYAETTPIGLKRKCQQRSLGHDARQLLNGRHPKSGAYIGRPVPLTECSISSGSFHAETWEILLSGQIDLSDA